MTMRLPSDQRFRAVAVSARRVSAFVLSLGLILAIGSTGVASGSQPGTPAESLDDRFLRVAQEVPSFGGIFADEHADVLYVYSSDLSAAVREHAQQTLRSAFEGEGLPQQVQMLPGRFTFGQLKAWHGRLNALVLGTPGVVLTDIDDASNRLTVGVEDPEAERRVEARLATGDIPREAIGIQRMAPVRAAMSLQDRHRPLVGGLQVAFPRGTAEVVCTLGWNAIARGSHNHQSVHGFVTNSHCTKTRGGIEGTVFHQPSESGAANRIGIELVDPRYFTSFSDPKCPRDRQCRYSDSAFVLYLKPLDLDQGHIARDSDNLLNPIEWNGMDDYRIRRKRDPVVGDAVRKVGKETGTTDGAVTRTCADANPAGTDITYLCQSLATLASDEGDSGAPVITCGHCPDSTDSALRGIFWGALAAPVGAGIFSPVSAVERELRVTRSCAPGFLC